MGYLHACILIIIGTEKFQLHKTIHAFLNNNSNTPDISIIENKKNIFVGVITWDRKQDQKKKQRKYRDLTIKMGR